MINNKSEVGYKEAFKSFKSIITIENSKTINLKGITTDFEVSLINAIKFIFPNIIHTGCFFHYVSAISKKLKSLKLNKGKYSKISEILLHELFLLPYNFNGNNKSYINELIDNVIKEAKNDISETDKNIVFNPFTQFKKYFINQWYEYFQNGTLDYRKVDKKFRSNKFH